MNFWDEVSLLIRSLDSQRVEAISIKMMSLPTPSEDHSSLKNSVDKKKKSSEETLHFLPWVFAVCSLIATIR